MARNWDGFSIESSVLEVRVLYHLDTRYPQVSGLSQLVSYKSPFGIQNWIQKSTTKQRFGGFFLRNGYGLVVKRRVKTIRPFLVSGFQPMFFSLHVSYPLDFGVPPSRSWISPIKLTRYNEVVENPTHDASNLRKQRVTICLLYMCWINSCKHTVFLISFRIYYLAM